MFGNYVVYVNVEDVCYCELYCIVLKLKWLTFF
jgi:hypothetical protein